LVELGAVLYHLGVVRVYLGTLYLDLGAERSDLRAQGVELTIDGIEPGAIVLLVLMLAQTDTLQMLQYALHVWVGSRMTNGYVRGSGC
jgi:hypothetical protein